MTELIKHEPITIYIKPSKGLTTLNLRDLWTYRELVFFMVWRDIKVRYKQTLLGAAWAIIQPVLTMLALYFLFDRVAKLPTDNIPYPLFSYTALLPWGLFVAALNQGSRSLTSNHNMITKVYFPKLILPLASVLAGLVDFAVASVIMVAMMFYYKITPPSNLLWVLPLFLLLAIVTAFGVALWLSAINVKYRDVNYVLPLSHPILVFCDPGRLFCQRDLCEVAACLFFKSHGWGGQRFPLGVTWNWEWSRRRALGFGWHLHSDPGQRIILFPQYGKDLRGYDLI